MFDTHCHLNFKAFKNVVDDVIVSAKNAGVSYFVVPGTDIKTSEQAVSIASEYECVYAAVGIHPHHIYEYQTKKDESQDYEKNIENDLNIISKLLINKKVVAVGEVGVDKYYYRDTKYSTYHINDAFIKLQIIALESQIKLALEHDKSLILHNRLASDLLFETLTKIWDDKLKKRTVIHCCEAEDRLLDFAIAKGTYIGVDGDVTFSKPKQQFIKKVPLNLLVVETDSPFIVPEPLKSQNKRPNTPANLHLIVKEVSRLKNETVEKIIKETTTNGKELFRIT